MVTDGLHHLSIRLVGGGPYGVRLSGGGREPLAVAKMHKRSKAMAAGVEVGDILLAINGQHCRHWTIDQAMDYINHSSPGDDVTLYLLRNVGVSGSMNMHASFDSYNRQSNVEPGPLRGTERYFDVYNSSSPAQYDTHQHHGQAEGAPPHYSSQLSTTSGDNVATPGEYTRKHISAFYHEAPKSASLMADLQQNNSNADRGRNAIQSAREDNASLMPKFLLSKPADSKARERQPQPMMWRPPSSLMAPKLPFTERPVSAPPYRTQPLSEAPPAWDSYATGQLESKDDMDMDTEVVIWSSKLEDSQPQPSNHASWMTRPLDQPISWVPQQEPEPLPVSNKVDISSMTPFDRAADESQYYGDEATDRPRSTPPEPPPRRRYLHRPTPDEHTVTPQWQQPRGLGPRWPSSPALGAHAQAVHTSGTVEEASPLFLKRVVITGDELDDVIDDVSAYGLKRKKMFADSSFYEDPDQKYPTIQQQIKMAREVAHLLTSPSGPSGRGQQMFLKRQQMSSQWKPESAPQLTHRPPPRRPGLFHDAEELRRWRSTPVVHTSTDIEELERLQTRAEKSRHDLLPPQLGARLAAELKSTSAAGGSTLAGRMFARRRDRAERSVVPEVPTSRRNTRMRPATPPDPVVQAPPPRQRAPAVDQPKIPTISKRQPEVVIDKPEVDSSQTDDGLSYPVRGGRLAKMIEVPRAAMTPWEAAEQYGGSVDPAFEHIDVYKAASSHITLDDFVDDDENVEQSSDPAEQVFQQTQPQSFNYSQLPAESYAVFDNQHAASSGDIYSQYNASEPYNYNYNNYDNYSSLQTVTNGAPSGDAIDMNHRSDMSYDWSRDRVSSGGTWQSMAGTTSYQPVYRPVKFHLPF